MCRNLILFTHTERGSGLLQGIPRTHNGDYSALFYDCQVQFRFHRVRHAMSTVCVGYLDGRSSIVIDAQPVRYMSSSAVVSGALQPVQGVLETKRKFDSLVGVEGVVARARWKSLLLVAHRMLWA